MQHKTHFFGHSSLLFTMALTFAACAGLAANTNAQTETVIGTPGSTNVGVIFDTAGNLYGVTENGGNSRECTWGCGTVYELSPVSDGTWTLTTLYRFQGLDDGELPNGGLIFDSSGNLYGTAQVGGTGGGGTVFKLSNVNGSWTETTLYSFIVNHDGLNPNSSLTFDSTGNLFGTTIGGGTRNSGTVFELSPTASGYWKENILHNFGTTSDGAILHGALVMDDRGNLYGTTLSGGSGDVGTVFEVAHGPGGEWIESILHSFTSGGQPFAGVILDAAHNLCGTTLSGGAFGYGTVFCLTRVNSGGHLKWKEITLHSFTDGTDGANPTAPLTQDAAGNLYSTTTAGAPVGCKSSYSCGQVFELSLDSNRLWSIAALYPVPGFFDPNGSLLLDSSGNIYGSAIDDHSPTFGEIYEVTP